MRTKRKHRGLWVKFSDAKDRENGCVEPPSWRVCLDVDGIECALRMSFARQCDAELAMAALEREGLTTASEIKKAGRKKYSQIMLEALQW